MELSSAGERDWAGRLARTPFADALAKGAALIVARGEPPEVEFATPAALALFDANDARALGRILFAADSLGSRRLLLLVREIAPDASPRLERLRFFGARKPVSVAWDCARIRRDGETYFVAAEPAFAAEEPVRFVWRLDAEARFGPPDAALVERLGAQAPHEGEALDALAVRVGLDPAWSARVAARETFSRLRVVWTELGGERGRPVWISGAPLFAAGGAYRGFRGFGLIAEASIALPPPPRGPAKKTPGPFKPVAGDAAALISLLQRQLGAPLPSAPGAASAPALAVISALAALLQPKARSEPKPAAPARPASVGAPKAPSGAEIVVLRPHANAAHDAAPAPREARETESVALTSQERDAFKEIARALGVNARPGRNAPSVEPEPSPPPGDDELAALLDILPVAVLVARGGEPLYANKTLLDLVGYADLADFRARDGVKSIFRGRDPRSLAPGGGVTGIPLLAAGEQLMTVDAHVRPAVWQGAPAELIAMRRSRDAEHQAELRTIERETAMHAARARDFAVALEAARDGMVRLDRNGRILGMNRGAEQAFGYDQKETAGDSFLTLLAPASQTEAAAALERLTRGEAAPLESLDAVARSQNGRQFPVRIDLGRLANMPEPDYFLLLTNREKAEAGLQDAKTALDAAERASAAKTELLSRVSHEMRTPLNAIIGCAEVMLEERFGALGNERYREYVRVILASGRHGLSLANDLLDLTKLELGKIDLRFAPVDVNSVVRDSIALMQPQASRARVIVRLSLYDRLPKIMADERSLRQMLLNLITNAVKFNEPGGQVIVSTALDEGGHAVLRVRDTGVGMSESELAIAQEPLGRSPGARRLEGTGLGLPITKALAEANHADFSIKSRRDQGTLVEIAFPALQAAQ
jgi:PAS domain S-box-containing protein